MKFDKNYFLRQAFSQNELNKYKKAAERDLSIAHNDKEIEVIFHFTYMALLKIGIFVIAKEGYRVKSRPGHHVQIIETLSSILKLKDVAIIGDKMRRDRNLDLYSASALITKKDVDAYYRFVSELFQTIK